MTFQLTEEQLKAFEAWKATLPEEPSTAIGGAYTFSFTATRLGTITKVTYYNGQSIDITNYEEW